MHVSYCFFFSFYEYVRTTYLCQRRKQQQKNKYHEIYLMQKYTHLSTEQYFYATLISEYDIIKTFFLHFFFYCLSAHNE